MNFNSVFSTLLILAIVACVECFSQNIHLM